VGIAWATRVGPVPIAAQTRATCADARTPKAHPARAGCDTPHPAPNAVLPRTAKQGLVGRHAKDETRFVQSLKLVANPAGRRAALRSFGAAGMALLAAMGGSQVGSAQNGGTGGKKKGGKKQGGGDKRQGRGQARAEGRRDRTGGPPSPPNDDDGDNGSNPEQPLCREEGHPCEGSQECCPGLDCKVSGPGRAKRASEMSAL
jgi:hypothetical protein